MNSFYALFSISFFFNFETRQDFFLVLISCFFGDGHHLYLACCAFLSLVFPGIASKHVDDDFLTETC